MYLGISFAILFNNLLPYFFLIVYYHQNKITPRNEINFNANENENIIQCPITTYVSNFISSRHGNIYINNSSLILYRLTLALILFSFLESVLFET